jgi:Tfp pilus assembly protein PilF
MVVVLVAAVAVAGVLAYSAMTNERAFDRHILEGDQAMAADRPFQAIEAYSGAIARDPESMLAHLKRAAVYQSQNELEAAARDLRRATELDPSALRAIELLGDVQVSLGRGERAIEQYEAFVAQCAGSLQAGTRALPYWPDGRRRGAAQAGTGD